MKPILPREMLWTEKQTMDEFFELDAVNEDFFEVFTTLREEPFSLKADAVRVFNEVYFQLTRIVYEQPLPDDIYKYMKDIKGNLGWSYSADLVMTMAYFLLSLVEKDIRPVNKIFSKEIRTRIFFSPYWKPFKHLFEKLKKEKRVLRYSFKPSPVSVDQISERYYNWNVITCNYDRSCIDSVIRLWDGFDDRQEVAKKIKDSIYMNASRMNYVTRLHLENILDEYILADEDAPVWMCAESSPYDESDSLRKRTKELEANVAAMQEHIRELEAENEGLKSLIETKKKTGQSRKFTLPQIVNYCKGSVQWDDVKQIVAMLNKLLRRNATEEDEKLVDSIEAEFINRRFGNTFNNANVTMHNPQIQDVYRISDNETVNLGDEGDGIREED